MTLAQRLAAKRKEFIKNPFQVRPKKEVSPESMWGMLEEIAIKVINERMRIFEARMEEKAQSVEDAAKELLDAIPQLKEKTDSEITRHITSRKVEIRGEKGDTGPQGIKGLDGKNGKDGASIIGPIGLAGKNGKDGSPDTPDQIVTKVIASEKKLPIAKIENLPETIEDIKRVVREKRGGGSGGGKGNTQHEHTAISSATTTVTTTYNIAGGGFSVDCYYNGQFLARGTDYTVSGKVITLSFVPQDNTVFDAVYERS